MPRPTPAARDRLLARADYAALLRASLRELFPEASGSQGAAGRSPPW